MQDVDNNMDNLFQKAADGYSIKPGVDNWDKILPQLNDLVFISKPEKRFIKYFPFITLLIVTMAGSIAIFDGDNIHKSANASLNKKDQQQNEEGINNKTKNIIAVNKKDKNIAIEPIKQAIYLSPPQTNKNEEKFAEDNHKLQQTISIKRNASNDVILHEHTSSLTNIISSTSLEDKKNNLNNTADLVSTQQSSIQKQHKLYAGFVSGLGFAQIKSQGFHRPDFTVGGLAGYRFTNKLSIETGVLLAGKYYSTDVRYFNMDKIKSSMPSGMEVSHIYGNSTMWEFPLNINYTFISKKKNELYVAAGTSSYLLTKEENKYYASLNGTQQNLNRSYTNTSFNFAATINAGIGYQYINKFNNALRIEPYVQIPLKGMGVGSLPIMSVGVQAGFMFK